MPVRPIALAQGKRWEIVLRFLSVKFESNLC